MTSRSQNLAADIFVRSEHNNLGDFSINSHMLGVLLDLDGRSSLAEIARRRGLSLPQIEAIGAKLLSLGLIKHVEKSTSTADVDFFLYLKAQLSQAVGPIAEILIEDAVTDLGHSANNFPVHQVAELVGLPECEYALAQAAVYIACAPKSNAVARSK